MLWLTAHTVHTVALSRFLVQIINQTGLAGSPSPKCYCQPGSTITCSSESSSGHNPHMHSGNMYEEVFLEALHRCQCSTFHCYVNTKEFSFSAIQRKMHTHLGSGSCGQINWPKGKTLALFYKPHHNTANIKANDDGSLHWFWITTQSHSG